MVLGSALEQHNQQHGHRRILTIDSTNINIEVLRPKSTIQRTALGIAVAAPAPNPNANARTHPDEDDMDADADALTTTAAELRRTFASASSLSRHKIRQTIHQRYHTSPTDGGHGASRPAVPEIGFGVMGRRWKPHAVDAHANANANTNANKNASGNGAWSGTGNANERAVGGGGVGGGQAQHEEC